MMPLAFAAGLGGTCTLIGTPPNIIANVALKAAGMGDLQFGFFEYAWVGVPITVAGILYMVFIGRHLLPKTDADDLMWMKWNRKLKPMKHLKQRNYLRHNHARCNYHHGDRLRTAGNCGGYRCSSLCHHRLPFRTPGV